MGKGPYPSPLFRKQVTALVSPLQAIMSGEIVAEPGVRPVGSVSFAGKVNDVWMSVGASGKDDSNTLSLSLDALINGVSCLSTEASIAHVSGEASQQKTTVVSGDTGIVQAVVDGDANDVSPGDVVTFDCTLTRTASPTTEIGTACLVIEITPN